MQVVLDTATSIPLAGAGGTIVGLLELLAWMILVLGLAASMTYGMVKLTNRRKKPDADPETDATAS